MLTEKRPVLYVDEEEANLLMFEVAYREVFEVQLATTAHEALRLLERFPIPVVIADEQMPRMCGVDIFQILKEQAPHIQRVILSGLTEPDEFIEAINTGSILNYVRKPWDRTELLAVIYCAMHAHDLSLQNSILREKLVLAERCAMLGQSAARIAHEMGNQLGILPLIEVIEDEYRHDDQLQELAIIAKMTHARMHQLIIEIQSFVRIDKIEGRPIPFSLTACINELVSILRFNQTIDASRLHLELKQDSVILGNPFKLQQVLINLLRNAMDAISKIGDGRVNLCLNRLNDLAYISVSDNGHGIAEQIIHEIWRPFFTTKGKSGTGLGLDVVQSIIKSHSGTINCSSVVGQGTTFEISLPVSMPRSSETIPLRIHNDVAQQSSQPSGTRAATT